MSLTAKQAHQMAIGLPVCCCITAVLVAIGPLLKSQAQQSGESQRTHQMEAIAKEVIAGRCLKLTSKAPMNKGGVLPDLTEKSLTTSCLIGSNGYGFLGVLNGNVTIVQIYSSREIAAKKSELSPTKPE